jgi:hypothetical protein
MTPPQKPNSDSIRSKLGTETMFELCPNSDFPGIKNGVGTPNFKRVANRDDTDFGFPLGGGAFTSPM